MEKVIPMAGIWKIHDSNAQDTAQADVRDLRVGKGEPKNWSDPRSWAEARRDEVPAVRGRTDSRALDVSVAAGCKLVGEFELTGAAYLDCFIKGRIAADGELTIGEAGFVEGDIDAAILRVFGRIQGDLRCSERLELLNGAIVLGDITSPVVVINEGVRFEGRCRMWREEVSDSQFETETEAVEVDEDAMTPRGDKNRTDSPA